MKTLFSITLSFILAINLFGQTQGINYQAVIIDEDPQEIPGVDIEGNILPNKSLMVRFTILDAAGTIEYQEEHSTSTDEYGMINLIIGWGTPTSSSPKVFTEIDWNGASKDLKVDISLDDTEIFYTDFSYDELTFVPYAYHRNITATGTMIIDGATTLKNRLDVINGSPAFLSGNLTVDEYTTLQNDLTVNATSDLNGQVTINADVNGEESSYDSYPLRVEGSNQGIAVKIDGSRNNENNFVTFWDDEKIQGRIEGQTTTELLTDPEYIYDNVVFGFDLICAGVDLGVAIAEIVSASSSSTVCAGLGACVTAPVPSLIVQAVANAVLEGVKMGFTIAEPIVYNVSLHTNIGITYQSGAGDYAEWLPKSDINEKFTAGDIVGVKGGYITKSTENADQLMVISYNPIVLGNMPEEGLEMNYEKVAFMGQVPVKVLGKVQIGDYVIPCGRNNGVGIAISPEDIQPDQYHKIVGMAWSDKESLQYDYVNLAVGLNTSDVARLYNKRQEQIIIEQRTEIDALKEQINQMNAALAQLIPEYSSLVEGSETKSSVGAPSASIHYEEEERTVIYYEVSEEHINEGIDLAEQILLERDVDISSIEFFTNIKNDPEFKANYISELKSSVNKELKSIYEREKKSGANVIIY